MRLPFDNLTAMVGRMTAREKRLFGVLTGAVIVVLAIAVYLGTSAVFGSIQDDIDHGRQAMAEIRQLAPRYQELAEAKRQIEEAIRNNRTTVRVAANEILKRFELTEDVQGATGNKLADIVSFEGKTTDTPVDLSKGKKKPTQKGKQAGGLVEIEQNLEFREVPFDALFQFLDAIEQTKDLLFVTKVDLGRKFNNLTHVRAVVTIATFQYQGEEPAAPAAAGEE